MLQRASTNELSSIVGADFSSPTTVTEGVEHGRTAGATTRNHKTMVLIMQPVRLTAVLLDVLTAGVVTLYIDGLFIASVACDAESEDNAFTPSAPLILLPGEHWFAFDYGLPEPSIYTSVSATFTGQFWADTGKSYYNTALAAYVPAFKITGEVGSLESVA